jgi:ribosomal protein S12 methylthiotransferase accessory factor
VPEAGDGGLTSRRGQVVVAGHGLLATAIAGSLAVRPRQDLPDSADLAFSADLPEAGQLLVTASDGWDCRAYEQVRALCAGQGAFWLPVRTEVGRTVIGPMHDPDEPGCVRCAEHRRSLASEHAAARESVRQRYPRLTDQPSAWLTTGVARTVAAVTADEVARWGSSRAGRAGRALLYVHLDTLAVSAHRFLPDPLCPWCGGLPSDDPELARLTLEPRPKPSPGSYRVRPLGEADLARLREIYVDEETGLIQRVQTFTDGGLAVGAATMRTRHTGGAETGWGRTRRHRTSQVVAVLEALERYGGMAPGGRRSAVLASFAEVSDKAVDPRALGLHPPESYARPGFPYHPFDPGLACLWAWGYSLARREPVLVPQAYAYYRTRVIAPGDPSFALEISNGCALGSCLEEAVLYAVLEVIERDAFLMTWYARLPAAQVDLSSARQETTVMLALAIEAETGYRVLAFDTTMEHGIPSVWAMAVRPAGSDGPALACAAGAHLDPEQAVVGALSELGPILADLIKRYPDIADRSSAMAGDSSLVATMDDHAVLYASHQAAARLDFLAGDCEPRSFESIGRRCGIDAFGNADLTDDLAEVLRRLDRHGLDVVVVDQTTPEHRAGGLCCVKAVLPGMLPMTFGHHYRRTGGLPRLFDVPRLLGHRDLAMPASEVNPYPHPFP